MRRITIFDTTLRDGDQTPGVSLNPLEKLEIARRLAELKVDVVEAGFPVSSPGELEAVSTVAKEVRDVSIAALARVRKEDIEAAGKALEAAAKPRLHVFLATSEIHRTYKLRKSKQQILDMAVWGIEEARKYVDNVEFSPEDASRTEPEFLVEVVQAAVAAGASTINIPDTVGYAMPKPFAELIARIRREVRGIEKAAISVHCHNDLGLAVANSMAAVEAGAEQVECTINGLGERAGNAPLEEIVMALNTRRDYFGATCGVVTNRLLTTSRFVSSLTGMPVPRNKAIVGANAFAHTSGVHQDGLLKSPATYEIMRPEDIGFTDRQLVLGKLSGIHAFKERVEQLGYKLSEAEIEAAFRKFKDLADKKKEIFDEDIEAIIGAEAAKIPKIFQLESMHISTGTQTTPTATVRIRMQDGRIVEDAATGDGPVDAVYRAIDRITRLPARLRDYHIRAVTVGKDAMGEVSLEVEFEATPIRSRAVSTDIIEASAVAYLNAINKVAQQRQALADSRREGPPRL